jgi:hypothetical protein
MPTAAPGGPAPAQARPSAQGAGPGGPPAGRRVRTGTDSGRLVTMPVIVMGLFRITNRAACVPKLTACEPPCRQRQGALAAGLSTGSSAPGGPGPGHCRPLRLETVARCQADSL